MTDPSPEKIRAWRALMHTHASVTTAIDHSLRSQVGIPGTWYEALVEIAFAGGTMRMHQFAAETTLTKSGATRFVDRLEAAGLVERTPCPEDRRAYNLVLTKKGSGVQKASDPHVLAAIEEHFGKHMTEEEASLIHRALIRTRNESAIDH